MNKERLMKTGFILLYLTLGGFFIYQGVNAIQQTKQIEKQVLAQEKVIEKAKSDIENAQKKHTVVKKVNLADYDKRAEKLGLLLYNTSFTNNTELKAYKNQVAKYVTPMVLEKISSERTPTVWTKDKSAPQYTVTNVGRMSVDKNNIHYLVILAPKDKTELGLVLEMNYDVNTGLVDQFKSERELKANGND